MSRIRIESFKKARLDFNINDKTAKGSYIFQLVIIPKLVKGLRFIPFKVNVVFDANIDYDAEITDYEYLTKLDFTNFEVIKPQWVEEFTENDIDELKSTLLEEIRCEFSEGVAL